MVDGRVLSFEVSGLYEGLFVMQDVETSSQWLHYTGECILGPFQGRALPMIPSTLISWKAFLALHGEGSVLLPTNPLWRRILSWLTSTLPLPFLPPVFVRTLPELDKRLGIGVLGLGLVVGQRWIGREEKATAKFYPLDQIKKAGLIHDRLADVSVLVVYDGGLGSAVAFQVTPGSRYERAGSGCLRDVGTGRRYDLAGRGVEDPEDLLAPAAGLLTRWYGFVATYPTAGIWLP